jgi:hypothetical protein
VSNDLRRPGTRVAPRREIPTTLATPDPSVRRARRSDERRRVIRRRRRRLLLALIALLALPPIYSYASMAMQPSSLPLSIRSVEWLRQNGFAWLVNDVEHYYYEWTAPSKGGPTIRNLPNVGSSKSLAAKPQVAYYHPPAVAPVISPPLSGEGVWAAVGPTVRGEPPVLVSVYRPDPSYPRVVAYAAWIDKTRTQLALYPGRYEPPTAPVRGPMSIPVSQRARLLATFNSGFTHADSGGGFSINGAQYEPLRTGQATLIAYSNGAVDVRTWHGGPTPPASIVVARQNLPLIVDNGKPNPNLNDGTQWGATLGNAVLVWRSAVGVDRHGNLIYAAANYRTVESLAEMMIHLGAVRAMQLDINAEWPSFITYGAWGAQQPAKLVPNYQQTARRYLSPDDRDFFAVYAPSAAGGNPGVPLH